MKSVLSIAASDSGGAAGIQADIKTIEAHGLFAQTALTALTAQNTTGVTAMASVGAGLVEKQLDAVFSDIFPAAVKVGACGCADNVRVVAKTLKRRGALHVVVDPVMVATSGSTLSDDETVSALRTHLLPVAELATPNLPEAEKLLGHPINSEPEQEAAALELLELGPRWALVKGGHRRASANDVLAGPGGAVFWFRTPHVETRDAHGTGCTLSSAIACWLAEGRAVYRAARLAKDYVTGALLAAPGLGAGAGPIGHMWPHKASIEAYRKAAAEEGWRK